jgi:hypothetical protein
MNDPAGDSMSIAGTYVRRLSEPRQYPVSYGWENEVVPILVSGVVNPAGPTLSVIACVRDKTSAPLALVYACFNPFLSELFIPGYFMKGDAGVPVSDQIVSTLASLGVFAHGLPTLCVTGGCVDALEIRSIFRRLMAQAPNAGPELERLRRFPLNPWDRISAGMRESAAEAAEESASVGANPERVPDADMDELLDIVLDVEHNKREVAALFYAWKGAIEQRRRFGNHKEADGAFQQEEFMKLVAFLLEAAEFEI